MSKQQLSRDKTERYLLSLVSSKQQESKTFTPVSQSQGSLMPDVCLRLEILFSKYLKIADPHNQQLHTLKTHQLQNDRNRLHKVVTLTSNLTSATGLATSVLRPSQKNGSQHSANDGGCGHVFLTSKWPDCECSWASCNTPWLYPLGTTICHTTP